MLPLKLSKNRNGRITSLKNCLEKLYEKYPDEASLQKFYSDWESLVSWLLYDAGASKFSPEKFNIPKP